MKRWGLTIAAMAIAGGAAAQDAETLMKYLINAPGTSYTVFGPNQSTRSIKDEGVSGGRAVRVTVSAKGPEVYTVGATVPIAKPIKKGDRMMVAFWARAPKLQEGETTPVAFYGVAQSITPYAPVVGGAAQITNAWKLHQVRGDAAMDVPVGQSTIVFHLSAEKAVIDLGPAFALDFGPKP